MPGDAGPKRPGRRTGPAYVPAGLSALPAGAGRAVFKDNAARLEVASNFVGTRKPACRARVAALGDQVLDLLDGNRRLLVFCAAEGQHTQDTIEAVEGAAHELRIAGADLTAID